MVLEWPARDRRKYGEAVAYFQNRKARNRGLRGELTAGHWIRTLRVFSERCVYCGRHADATYHRLTADHFVPLARGGNSTVDNILPACLDCNQLKADLHPAIWLLWRFGEAGAMARMQRIQAYFASL